MKSRQVTDQLGRTIELNEFPQRIVSLVPSQTELLADLGLADRVVGITKFCVHPELWYLSKKRVGGTKKVAIDAVARLKPDLIIGNKEENTKHDIDALAERFPVWMSDVHGLADALDMISKVGHITGTAEQATTLVESIRRQFEQINEPESKPKVLYLIWKDPFMAAGRNTFIHCMIEYAGFSNCIKASDSRYPQLKAEDIEAMNPDIILLSSEPFPFKGKHSEEVMARFPNFRIKEVNGELFSWYGSRLLKSTKYFNELQQDL